MNVSFYHNCYFSCHFSPSWLPMWLSQMERENVWVAGGQAGFTAWSTGSQLRSVVCTFHKAHLSIRSPWWLRSDVRRWTFVYNSWKGGSQSKSFYAVYWSTTGIRISSLSQVLFLLVLNPTDSCVVTHSRDAHRRCQPAAMILWISSGNNDPRIVRSQVSD